ncbi:hypothetical protein WJX72_000433 [[Myrmecia] bisecta]|uniref:Nudix hydrolase domain-containing protein n=1 Tax=[Myrmecia] bisecta TaxID=41462 RepID=A0AAW1PZK0_9CHLO
MVAACLHSALATAFHGIDHEHILSASSYRAGPAFRSASAKHPKPPTRHSVRYRSKVVVTPMARADAEPTFIGRTPEALKTWLENHHVCTSSYGGPGVKSLEELLAEVQKGESILQASKVGRALRTVNVLNVYVRNQNNQVLEEEYQIRPDGAERRRGLPLAEKLLAGERWQEAVGRAVLEELGPALSPQPQIEVLEATYRESVETTESNSYPGLQTQYHCHCVEAMVGGLPTTERFVTTEQRPHGVLQNHWRWQPYTGLECAGKAARG